MKVIVERRHGSHVDREMVSVGETVDMDDSYYGVRIVGVVDDDGNEGPHCGGCGNDDGPSWCRGVQ